MNNDARKGKKDEGRHINNLRGKKDTFHILQRRSPKRGKFKYLPR